MIEQFLKNKRLIKHYYIAIILLALFLASLSRNRETLDMTILIILAIYVLLFPIVILYTRKYAVHIFLFSLAFITGFYSFYYYSVEPHSVLNALYFTFQLYLLIVTDVFIKDGSSLLHYPLIVEIARWSAALYTISTLFIAMYRILENSILLALYQIIGKHYIIFGYNENSMALIEDLRHKRRPVILVANNLSNEASDYLEELKVVLLNNRNDRDNLYVKCRVARAKAVILLHEEDLNNLDEFMELQHYFNTYNKISSNLTIYIHLQKVTSKKLFLDLETTVKKENRPFQVKLINLYEIFVDELFAKYPIDKDERNKEDIHLFIIGFGTLGQHIALKAISQYDQTEKSMPQITAIDKHMSKIKQTWTQHDVNRHNNLTISLYSFDIEVDRLDVMINKQKLPITHIYVCLHEDKLDLLAGIELSNQLADIPIYLKFSEASITDKWIKSDVSGNRLIYGTGTFKDILKEETLLK